MTADFFSKQTRGSSPSFGFVLILTFGLLLQGCASLHVEPFRGFQAAVSAGQKGLSTEMTRDVHWAREADVQDVANAKDARLSAYMVKEVKGYSWTMESVPPHWEARRTLKALDELNGAFSAYVSLLVGVAEGRVKDEAEFDGLAETLNETLRGLTITLSGIKTTDKSLIAGTSALGTESLRRFLSARKARSLEQALRENQPLVDGYAVHCRALIPLIRADLKASYTDQVQAIHDRWDDKRSPGRVTLTRSMFNLNEEYVTAMESLQALEVFYTVLPAAHRDLADAVTKSQKSRKALATLYDSAVNVSRLASDLEKSR